MLLNERLSSRRLFLTLLAMTGLIGPALGQTVTKRTGAAQATPVHSKANAPESSPVTVYPKVDNGYSLVTWNTLSHFAADTPDIDEEIDPKIRMRKKPLAIPGFITALNKASVAVVGFMLPMDIDDKGDKTSGFILARSQGSCCYGITPKLNEWIYVQMPKDSPADIVMDIPLTVFGVLEVGEKNIKDEGWSLYRMSGKKVGVPKISEW